MIWPFLRSLFITKPLDYVLGLIGAFSVASIASISFSLDFGPVTQALLEYYRQAVAWVLDPVGHLIIWLIKQLVPQLDITLSLPDAWKDGIVLLGIYYQKHGRNEWKAGNRVTAVYQFVVGVVVALGFGLGLSAINFESANSSTLIFVGAFALAVIFYDVAFLVWSTIVLRKKFAQSNNRFVEPPWSYFFTRLLSAAVRVGTIAAVTLAVFAGASSLLGDKIVGEAITFMMLLIGLAWASRGLRMATEKPGNLDEVLARYKSYPAGQLGSAIVFPILLGYLLVVVGLAETPAAQSIELALSIFGF